MGRGRQTSFSCGGGNKKKDPKTRMIEARKAAVAEIQEGQASVFEAWEVIAWHRIAKRIDRARRQRFFSPSLPGERYL